MSFAFYAVSIIAMLATIPVSVFLSKKYSQSGEEIHPLIKDRLFLFSIYMSASISIVISAIIIVESISSGEYYLDFSSQGFVNAFELFKVPVSILAAGFAAAALVAAIHRSMESNIQIQKTNQQIKNTELQIEKTDEKNRFDNYIKHRDQFIIWLSEIEAIKYYRAEFLHKEMIYRGLFGNHFTRVDFVMKENSVRRFQKAHKLINEFFMSEVDEEYDFQELFNNCSYIIKSAKINFNHSTKVKINGVPHIVPIKDADYKLNSKNVKFALIRNFLLLSAVSYKLLRFSDIEIRHASHRDSRDIFYKNIETFVESDRFKIKY